MGITRRSALAAVAGALVLPRAVAAQERTKIVAAGLPEDSATPVLYAVQRGAFAKTGLDVTVASQHSGSAVAAGIAGGSYQIGKVSMYPLIEAHGKGIPFTIIAPGGLSTADHPIAALMIAKNSTIKHAKELNGATVAVGALNDVFSLSLKAWMDKNGGDSSTLKLLEIPISAIAEAIATGRVVAGSANEPILSTALATGKVKVLAHTFDAVATRWMFTAWCAMKPWADAHRPACEAFRRVVIDSAKYANAHPAATVGAIAKFTELDPSKVRAMPRTLGGTTFDLGLIQPVIDVVAKYKDIPARFDAKELIWS
jgi:NitT/TauT family transport system substrate-binding protein